MIFHILFNYNQSNQIMDEKIRKILEDKIHESTDKRNEITLLVKSLGHAENPNIFGQGIIIGSGLRAQAMPIARGELLSSTAISP